MIPRSCICLEFISIVESGVPITIIQVKANDQDLHFAGLLYSCCSKLTGGIVLSELPYNLLVHSQDEAIWRLNLKFGTLRLVYGRIEFYRYYYFCIHHVSMA